LAEEDGSGVPPAGADATTAAPEQAASNELINARATPKDAAGLECRVG
jgi:hypothetical protein